MQVASFISTLTYLIDSLPFLLFFLYLVHNLDLTNFNGLWLDYRLTNEDLLWRRSLCDWESILSIGLSWNTQQTWPSYISLVSNNLCIPNHNLLLCKIVGLLTNCLMLQKRDRTSLYLDGLHLKSILLLLLLLLSFLLLLFGSL